MSEKRENDQFQIGQRLLKEIFLTLTTYLMLLSHLYIFIAKRWSVKLSFIFKEKLPPPHFWKVFWKASCLGEKLVVQIRMHNPQVFRSIQRGTRYGANTSWCRRLDLRHQWPLLRQDYLLFVLSMLVILFTQMGWCIWASWGLFWSFAQCDSTPRLRE